MIDTSKMLYFVDIDERQNVLLALDVQFIEEDECKGVGFYDTNRGRMFFGEITILESQFKIESDNNNVMVFR